MTKKKPDHKNQYVLEINLKKPDLELKINEFLEKFKGDERIKPLEDLIDLFNERYREFSENNLSIDEIITIIKDIEEGHYTKNDPVKISTVKAFMVFLARNFNLKVKTKEEIKKTITQVVESEFSLSGDSKPEDHTPEEVKEDTIGVTARHAKIAMRRVIKIIDKLKNIQNPPINELIKEVNTEINSEEVFTIEDLLEKMKELGVRVNLQGSPEEIENCKQELRICLIKNGITSATKVMINALIEILEERQKRRTKTELFIDALASIEKNNIEKAGEIVVDMTNKQKQTLLEFMFDTIFGPNERRNGKINSTKLGTFFQIAPSTISNVMNGAEQHLNTMGTGIKVAENFLKFLNESSDNTEELENKKCKLQTIEGETSTFIYSVDEILELLLELPMELNAERLIEMIKSLDKKGRKEFRRELECEDVIIDDDLADMDRIQALKILVHFRGEEESESKKETKKKNKQQKNPLKTLQTLALKESSKTTIKAAWKIFKELPANQKLSICESMYSLLVSISKLQVTLGRSIPNNCYELGNKMRDKDPHLTNKQFSLWFEGVLRKTTKGEFIKQLSKI